MFILSRSGGPNDIRLRDKRRRSEPRTRARGVNRGLPHAATKLRESYLCRHYYLMEIHCGPEWPRTVVADAKSMYGGIPMRSALPSAKILMNKLMPHYGLRRGLLQRLSRRASSLQSSMKRFVTGAWQALRRRFTMTSRPSWTILWLPSDTDDVPGDDDDQVHKAVDFYNAGTTVLHVHLHGADGKGSKRMFVLTKCWIACAPPCRRRCCKRRF
jgi:hypothetical protein